MDLVGYRLTNYEIWMKNEFTNYGKMHLVIRAQSTRLLQRIPVILYAYFF